MPRNRKGKYGNVNKEYLDKLAAMGAPQEVIEAEDLVDILEHGASCDLLGVPDDWAGLSSYDYQNPVRVNPPQWDDFRAKVEKLLPAAKVLHAYWKNEHSLQILRAAEMLDQLMEINDLEPHWKLCQTLREIWRCGVIYLTWDALPDLKKRGWYVDGKLAARLTLADLPLRLPNDPEPTPEPDPDPTPDPQRAKVMKLLGLKKQAAQLSVVIAELEAEISLELWGEL